MKYLGLLFTALWTWVLFLSFEFQWGVDKFSRPILLFVGLWILLFLLLMLTACVAKNSPLSWKWVIAFGLFFRLLMVFSNPIQESDFYRYLWDGAVLAEGVNPYKYSPREVLLIRGEEGLDKFYVNKARYSLQQIKDLNEEAYPYSSSVKESIEELKKLAHLSSSLYIDELHYHKKWNANNAYLILDRVNHPKVPTIYPPVAQGIFAFSALLKKGSLHTLRVIFVLFEALTMFLLVKILLLLKLPGYLVFWYAWNPLVIKEFVNSPHLDVIMVSMAVVSLYFWLRGCRYISAVALGLAIGAKYFVGPLLLFYVLWEKRKAIGPALVTALIVLSGFMLFSSAGARQFQGLKTMAVTDWSKNAVVVELIEPLMDWVLKKRGKEPSKKLEAYEPFYFLTATGPDIADDDRVVYHETDLRSKSIRQVLFLSVIFTILFVLWRSRHLVDKKKRLADIGICLTVLFLLSPIANPWYAGILMVFLPFFQRPLFVCVLGLVLGSYYLWFYLRYHEVSPEDMSFGDIVLLQGWLLLIAFLSEWGRIRMELRGGSDGSN